MKFVVFIFLFFTLSFADELRSLTNRGISAFRKGDMEKALEYFYEAEQKFPTSNEAKFNKGLVLSYLGDVDGAEKMLSRVKFDNDAGNIETLRIRARIADAIGDFLAENQQPNFSQARIAYKTARAFYAQALDLNPRRKSDRDLIQLFIENLTYKINNLPEEESQQNQDGDDNQDDQDNQDNQDNEGNQDKQDDQDEDNNDENENEQEQRQNEQQDNSEEEELNEEKIQDALRLIQLHADDDIDLKRPPVQETATKNERDW